MLSQQTPDEADMLSQRRRQQYYASLLQFSKRPEEFKEQIKQMLPFICLQESELFGDNAQYCLLRIFRNTEKVETCKEFIDCIDLENKKPLLYPILIALCHRPHLFFPRISELAPKAYEEENESTFKDTCSCIIYLILNCQDENTCWQLLQKFPLDKTYFETGENPDPLIHLLIRKNFQDIIIELLSAEKLNLSSIGWDGRNALHKAAYYNRYIGLLKLLINAGISPLDQTISTSKYNSPKTAKELTKSQEIYDFLLAQDKKLFHI